MPEVIALAVDANAGNLEYLAWLRAETKPG
jgi:hypothetical protein